MKAKITCRGNIRIILGRQGRMELKRRFKDHPLRESLVTHKPLSYWSTNDCLQYADQLEIDYSDLVSSVKILPKVESAGDVTRRSLPQSYKISVIVLDLPTPINIELVSNTRVSELKYFLSQRFDQPKEDKQHLWFKNKEMEDSASLQSLFGNDGVSEIKLVRDIDITYEMSEVERKITIAENIFPRDLLKSICFEEELDPTRHELFFSGNFIDGIDLPIYSLGIQNQTVVQVALISLDLFNWDEPKQTDLFTLASGNTQEDILY